jgi:hypothetical protein
MVGQDEQPGRLSEEAEDLELQADQSKDVKGGIKEPRVKYEQLDEISLVDEQGPGGL